MFVLLTEIFHTPSHHYLNGFYVKTGYSGKWLIRWSSRHPIQWLFQINGGLFFSAIIGQLIVKFSHQSYSVVRSTSQFWISQLVSQWVGWSLGPPFSFELGSVKFWVSHIFTFQWITQSIHPSVHQSVTQSLSRLNSIKSYFSCIIHLYRYFHLFMDVDLQRLGSGMRKATETWLISCKQSPMEWNSMSNSQWVRESFPISEDLKSSFSGSQLFLWESWALKFKMWKTACST